jgi:hypothetical protein
LQTLLIPKLNLQASVCALGLTLLGAPQAAHAISTQWNFQPNAITISTSEGAPYGDAAFWAGESDIDMAHGYGPTKIIRLYICLSGEVDFDQCSQQPAFTFNVTLPPSLPSGLISAALLIPDPAPSLSGQPVFALPLNSVDGMGAAIFDKNTGLNVFATFASEPPSAAPDLNQHGWTGSWYESATSGQGLEVEVFPDHVAPGTGLVQVSWFTYDTAVGGADHQRWYTLSGPVVSGQPIASLTIYENTGGNFNAAPVTNAQAVGTAMLSFDTCTSGQLSYVFRDGSGRTGAMQLLTRVTQNVTCSMTSARPTNADFALSGNWYGGAATSGQGFTAEVNPISGAFFSAWYTYAPTGASVGAAGQRWYTAQGSFARGMRSIPVTIFETTGGMFDTPTPPGQNTMAVGNGTMTFQSCSAAKFDYNFIGGSSSGLSGTIILSRVGPVPPDCTS